VNTTTRTLSITALLATFILSVGCTKSERNLTIASASEDDRIVFAIEELAQALRYELVEVEFGEDSGADIHFVLVPDHDEIDPEGYMLSRTADQTIEVLARDAAGAMYGGLELAEQIELYGMERVKEAAQNPYMEMRGTKFNIPLDVRTPSYTDMSDAAQNNMLEMWSFDFWKEYIDNMARYRYNFISLWSLHPFPSLVKVPKYPEVALDDVLKSKAQLNEYYDLGAVGIDAPEIVENHEVILQLTIEEKIDFWKKVMRYGKSRNVDFYVITWNIFVNGTEGKYGITTDVDNETTRDYFRHSVAQLFRTYPDLAGIGLTTGENMRGVSFEEKEDWAYDTYARGILEVAKEMPEREFTFIHRQHQADPAYIAEKFTPLVEQKNIDFIYSFKYAQAHVFSATEQPYHEGFVENIGDLKTIWTLRNDDAYYFRWGSPIFVREFIENIPYEVSQGMYYGSDQWIWGREFTSKISNSPRQLEVVKHWYHWMMWGRLSFDPQMSNERFIQILQEYFPDIDANKLFQAWHEASMIYPVTTGFHWGSLDFIWYIEGSRSRPQVAKNETGFHDVNTFIDFPVHDKSGNQSIPDYVNMLRAGTSSNLRSPLEVAAQLHQHAEEAVGLADQIEAANNAELKATLHDIKTIAKMGKYYAHKIAGSTYVALYRETEDKSYQEKAISELTEALEYWKQYVDLAMQQNINPIWTNRVGHVDWVKTTNLVEQDIAMAKADTR